MREFLRVVFCRETTFDGRAELVISPFLSTSRFRNRGYDGRGRFVRTPRS